MAWSRTSANLALRSRRVKPPVSTSAHASLGLRKNPIVGGEPVCRIQSLEMYSQVSSVTGSGKDTSRMFSGLAITVFERRFGSNLPMEITRDSVGHYSSSLRTSGIDNILNVVHKNH